MLYRPGLLRGKTALVTGGGTGICRGIALALAQAGADVAITSRKQEHLDPTVDDLKRAGVRAIGMWGRPMAQRFSNQLEFVGLCDINGKRVELARQAMGVSCPTFTDFDRMCDTAKPELLMVTTVDAFHAGYIVRALDRPIGQCPVHEPEATRHPATHRRPRLLSTHPAVRKNPRGSRAAARCCRSTSAADCVKDR